MFDTNAIGPRLFSGKLYTVNNDNSVTTDGETYGIINGDQVLHVCNIGVPLILSRTFIFTLLFFVAKFFATAFFSKFFQNGKMSFDMFVMAAARTGRPYLSGTVVITE